MSLSNFHVKAPVLKNFDKINTFRLTFKGYPIKYPLKWVFLPKPSHEGHGKLNQKTSARMKKEIT